MYEVLPTEPIHDVKEHISNIITEIVAHLTSEEKKLCQHKLSLVSGTRDQLRGSDYREILIVLAKQLRGENTYACKYRISKKYRKPKQNDMNTHSLTSRAIISIFSINVFLSIRIHV